MTKKIIDIVMAKTYITTSWDDGLKDDLKLASLLKKYNLPATFYVAPKDPRSSVLSSEKIRKLSNNHEIGGHTLHHVNLVKVPVKLAREEIINGKKHLENIIDKEVISFAYPWGAVNSDIKQLVGFSGFSFARTTKGFSTSILDRLSAPITVKVSNNFKLSPLLRGALYRKLFYKVISERMTFDWEKWAEYSLDYCLSRGGIFHLFGHAWEVERNNDWQKLERVFAHIEKKTKRSQRYTNGELTEEIEKDKRTYYAGLDPKIVDREHQTPYYKVELKRLERLVSDFDKKGVKVIDIGCGGGRVSSLFGKADYLGVDYSKKFIKFATKKYKRKNRKFLHCDFVNTAKSRFGKQDLIILWGYIDDHINPIKTISSLSALVKKGTKILVTLHNLENPFYRGVKFIRSEFYNQPYSLTSFSRSFMENELNKFCEQERYKFEFTSLGLITPSLRYIPYIPAGKMGNTFLVIIEKL